jgi:predicted protein tyrosine phosphatase
VFTRYTLNGKHDVLALGVDVNTPETIRMLSEWAEVILIAEPIMKKKIPVRFQRKIDTRFTIGADIFPVSIGGKLKHIVHNKLKELKYI